MHVRVRVPFAGACQFPRALLLRAIVCRRAPVLQVRAGVLVLICQARVCLQARLAPFSGKNHRPQEMGNLTPEKL